MVGAGVAACRGVVDALAAARQECGDTAQADMLEGVDRPESEVLGKQPAEMPS